MTAYQYNAYGLPTVVDYPGDPDVGFTYDALGRRTGMTDGSGTTTWAYDVMGRLVTTSQSAGGATVSYSYAPEGRLRMTLATASESRTWNYGYDQAGRLEVIQDGPGSFYQYGYEPGTGRLTETLFPHGGWIQKSFDASGRLLSTSLMGRQGQTVRSFGYTYDKAGQRTTENGNRGDVIFEYDEKRQLTKAQGVKPEGGLPQEYHYSFDPIGNWLEGDIGRIDAPEPLDKAFTANEVNQYTRIEPRGLPALTPMHDANGNMTSDGERVFGWDQENRLVSAGSSGFRYDGMNRRVETGYAGNVTRYVYDGLLPIAELDETGGIKRTVTRGLDMSGTLEGAGGIGGILATKAGGTTGYYFTDGNGNVTAIVDGNERLIAEYAYDPFGNKLFETGAYSGQPYQWSSKEWDEASGLVYYLYRYYDPRIGRWTSRDAIGEEGSLAIYAFVDNVPTTHADALGLKGVVSSWIESSVKQIFQEERIFYRYEKQVFLPWKLPYLKDTGFKYSVYGGVRTRFSDNRFCGYAGAQAQWFGQTQMPVPIGALASLYPLLRLNIEPTFGLSGNVECCSCKADMPGWEFRLGSMYCNGDIKAFGGVKVAVVFGKPDLSPAIDPTEFQFRLEGGGFLGASYSFRTGTGRIDWYLYFAGSVVYKPPGGGVVSHKIPESRFGSNAEF